MIEIKLREGGVALVDECDRWALEHTWYLNKTSHGGAYVRCRRIGYLHRLIMNPPKFKVVDHINGDTLDNRRSNLRVVTARQNSINRPRNFGRRLPGQYKGVVSVRGRWRAQVKFNGKFISLGIFDSEVLAAIAYDRKSLELWGEMAFTNFPLEIHTLLKEEA